MLLSRFKDNARAGLMAKLGRGAYDPQAAAKVRPAEPRIERAIYLRFVKSLCELWAHKVADRLELGRRDHSRADAGPLLVADWETLVDQSGLNGMLDKIGLSIADRNQKYFDKVVKVPAPSYGKPAEMIRDFRDRNIKLIKGLGTDQVDRLNATLSKANAQGLRHEEITALVQKDLGVGLSRAKLIARDQTLKHNAAVQAAQAQAAGVTRFRWSTSHDGAVRPMHKALDGKIFEYADPPVTNEAGDHNLPGEDYQCRCVAIPVIDLFAGIDDAPEDPTVLNPRPRAPAPPSEPEPEPAEPEPAAAVPYAERVAVYEASAERFATFAEQDDSVIVPLQAYTSDSKAINTAARKLANGLEIQPEHARKIADLQKALNASIEAGHANPGRVYRGLSAKQSLIAALKTGTFESASFLSTSIDPITAEEFMSSDGGAPMFMKIIQKTGIPLEGVTSVRGEKEILLRAGSRFRVDSMVKTHGVWEVHLTEL